MKSCGMGINITCAYAMRLTSVQLHKLYLDVEEHSNKERSASDIHRQNCKLNCIQDGMLGKFHKHAKPQNAAWFRLLRKSVDIKGC